MAPSGLRDTTEVASLLARGTEEGCLQESEIESLVLRLELDEADVEELRERLADAGVEVRDDCGKREVPATTYANGDLAHYSVDAMTQFLAEAGRHPVLTAAEEVELAKRIERGDLAAKEQLISHNLRLVVSIAKRYRVSTAEMGEPERTVIRLRYGLDDEREPQSYAAIGRRLEMTPERVHQIEEGALEQLALRRELAALRAA